ncbi:MAG: acyl carrier protein [Egibacteraceae bacterium]
MRHNPQLIARISSLIRDALNVEVAAPDMDLIDTGLLDSLALVTLITEIEQEFAYELPLDDFDVERFRSVERIADLLANAGVLNGTVPA